MPQPIYAKHGFTEEGYLLAVEETHRWLCGGPFCLVSEEERQDLAIRLVLAAILTLKPALPTANQSASEEADPLIKGAKKIFEQEFSGDFASYSLLDAAGRR